MSLDDDACLNQHEWIEFFDSMTEADQARVSSPEKIFFFMILADGFWFFLVEDWKKLIGKNA